MNMHGDTQEDTQKYTWRGRVGTSMSCRLRYAPFRSLLHQLATAYGLRSLRRRTPKQSLRYGVPPLKT